MALRREIQDKRMALQEGLADNPDGVDLEEKRLVRFV
jgi:hypothetical protein